MKTSTSELHTIAWFKIADFVARGEKERALHMYPLLMHSVSEPAIAYQLEGDILLAFQDMTALSSYYKAAQLYKKSGKFRQAIGVYKHIKLFIQNEEILKELVDMYMFCNDVSGFITIFIQLSKFYLDQNQQEILQDFLQTSKDTMPLKFVTLAYAHYIRLVMIYQIPIDDLSGEIAFCLKSFLQLLEYNHNLEKEFQKFLSALKILNPSEFEKNQKYLY